MTESLTLLQQSADLVAGSDEVIRMLGIKIVNWMDFEKLVLRFSFNLVSTVILIRFLYYAQSKRKDYLFTYMLISITVFLLCFLLDNVKLQLGFALGLFAIFGIIRYRTDPIPIKEMTYLFVVIGLSVVNALANKKVSWAELLFTNTAILGITFVLERVWLLKHESCKTVVYEKIENIKPERNKELMDDLEDRTGLKIRRVEIGRIDFMRDIARLKIYYYESENRVNQADYDDSNIPDDND